MYTNILNFNRKIKNRPPRRPESGRRSRRFPRHSVCLLIVLSTFFSIAWVPARAWADTKKEGVAYVVHFAGIEDPPLKRLLEESSVAVQERETYPPATVRFLRRRVQEDIPRLTAVMRSEGYYDARFDFQVDRNSTPVRVTFEIASGPLYTFRNVEIAPAEGTELPPEKVPSPAELGLYPGRAARAAAVVDAEAALLRHVREKGYPYPKIAERRALVQHGARAMDLLFVLDSGPRACFGEVEIEGLTRLEEQVVRDLIPWRFEDPYDPGPLEVFQDRLRATGFFSIIRVEKGTVSEADGKLPLKVVLTERKLKTIATTLYYRTDEGFGGRFSWENRNLFGEGEHLGFTGTLSRFEQGGEFSFRKPWFLRQDQRLEMTLRLADDKPDAYEARSYTGRFLVGRKLRETLELGLGVQAKVSTVTQFEEKNRFKYLSFPVSLAWDGTKDLLDPERGGRLAVEASPYLDLERRDADFLKVIGTMTHYVPVIANRRLILAGRVSAGAEPGPDVLDIPADERLYAGGGGSIRGYAYQSVGPLRDGSPIGGKALLEMSVEARLGMTDTIGAVLFLDGGSAFSDRILDDSSDVLWGTGIGLRYITPIGPLRLDVGIPLNRRPDVDEPFQVYISLGQAF